MTVNRDRIEKIQLKDILIMPNKNMRIKQSIDTKNNLLDSCLELMQTRSFRELKISDICAQAGVTTGAFYHYFSKKDDIIPELYLRIDQLFTTFYQKLRGSCYREKISEYLLRHAKFAEGCGLLSTRNVYYEQLDSKYEFFGDFKRGFAQHLLELVQAALDEGEFVSEKGAREITTALMSIERGAVYSWCLTNGALSAKTLSKKLVGVYLDSLIPVIKEENS